MSPLRPVRLKTRRARPSKDLGGSGLCGGFGTPWGTKSSAEAESSSTPNEDLRTGVDESACRLVFLVLQNVRLGRRCQGPMLGPRQGEGSHDSVRRHPSHFLRLTVTDVQRSREFYTGLLSRSLWSCRRPETRARHGNKLLFGGVVHARGNLVPPWGCGRWPPRPTASTRTGPGGGDLSFGAPARGADADGPVVRRARRDARRDRSGRRSASTRCCSRRTASTRTHRAGSRGRRERPGSLGRKNARGTAEAVTMPRLTRQDFERLLEFRVTPAALPSLERGSGSG